MGLDGRLNQWVWNDTRSNGGVYMLPCQRCIYGVARQILVAVGPIQDTQEEFAALLEFESTDESTLGSTTRLNEFKA